MPKLKHIRFNNRTYKNNLSYKNATLKKKT